MTDGEDPNGGEERPRRLMGPLFWIALVFGLACVVAGLALAKLGPKYF